MEVVVFNEKIYHFSTTLETTLADVTYSCGALLDELNLPPGLESVYIRDHQCGDTTEKLYYFVVDSKIFNNHAILCWVSSNHKVKI